MKESVIDNDAAEDRVISVENQVLASGLKSDQTASCKHGGSISSIHSMSKDAIFREQSPNMQTS